MWVFIVEVCALYRRAAPASDAPSPLPADLPCPGQPACGSLRRPPGSSPARRAQKQSFPQLQVQNPSNNPPLAPLHHLVAPPNEWS